jgi:hypothetical protein
MRALSLNCRGLGNPQTVNELHDVVKKEGPNLVFLMETRLTNSSLEWLRVQLRMRGCLGVDRHESGGGGGWSSVALGFNGGCYRSRLFGSPYCCGSKSI